MTDFTYPTAAQVRAAIAAHGRAWRLLSEAIEGLTEIADGTPGLPDQLNRLRLISDKLDRYARFLFAIIPMPETDEDLAPKEVERIFTEIPRSLKT
jgi:hypothetical protein